MKTPIRLNQSTLRIAAGSLRPLIPATVGVILIACGGGSDLPIEAGHGEDVSLQAALLTPADMPGGNWTVAEDDAFGLDQPLASVPACAGLASVLGRIEEEATARAETRLWANPGPVIQIKLSTFSTSDLADELIADGRELSSEEIAECSSQTAKRALRDLSASVMPSRASAAAPHNGIAYADDRDIEGPGGSRRLFHTETYKWKQGSVYVSVDFLTLGGVDATSLVSTVLQRISDSVSAILKSD